MTNNLCGFDGCIRPRSKHSKKWCDAHRVQAQKKNPLKPLHDTRKPNHELKKGMPCPGPGSVAGAECGRPITTYGLCVAHSRQRYKKLPLTPVGSTIGNRKLSAYDRFMSKIKIDPETNCWLWQDSLTRTGHYGSFGVRGKKYLAHRWSYQHHNDVVLSPEESIDHLCRVRHCVNPEHLESVTQRENSKRMFLHKALEARIKYLEDLLAFHGIDVL